jgi:K+/H+ antiporter YhaU regulatory subunit KhtT
MNKEHLEKRMQDKKALIAKRLEEYQKTLLREASRARCSTDFENIASTSVRYASVIARLEGELQQLEDMMSYL